MPLTPSGAARARWAAVVVAAAALTTTGLVGPAALPGLLGAGGGSAGAAAADTSPAALLARAAASAGTPFTGTASSVGALGLPDLPRLGAVASLLGGTTRTRTWYASPTSWRTDVLTATGERGAYADGAELTTWDYESDRLTTGGSTQGAHLPRAADLLPPAAARALLAGPDGPARAAQGAVALGARTVAGRTADGVRLLPGTGAAAGTTLSRADVWVDRETGLPLQVDLVDALGMPAVSTAFDTVVPGPAGAPDAAVLAAPDPPGATTTTAEADLAAAAAAGSPWRLPAQLAGLDATGGSASADGSAVAVDADGSLTGRAGVTGVAVYGTGLQRLAVVPLTPSLAATATTAALAAGALDLGDPDGAVAGGASGAATAVVGDPLTGSARGALVRAGALVAAVVDAGDGRHAYLLGGTASPELVRAAATALLDDPPRRAR